MKSVREREDAATPEKNIMAGILISPIILLIVHNK